MRYVYGFGEIDQALLETAGGKGGNLARLYQAGFPVPEGFVILPGAFTPAGLDDDSRRFVKAMLDEIRRHDKKTSFAVRSSAVAEDSQKASFAGEFETILDVSRNEEIFEAIGRVSASGQGARVKAYSAAKDVESGASIAVVVQKLIRPDFAGVLFTADPVSERLSTIKGNYIHGLGERLVSGEASPCTFSIRRADGAYEGPDEFKRHARALYGLGVNVESMMGFPQDIEWAIAGGKAYVLQSRPITSLNGYDPVFDQWNDSLDGDFLWTNCNSAEAFPGVMTPLSRSLWDWCYNATNPATLPPGYRYKGNIGGRGYFNFSLMVSLFRMAMKPEDALYKAQMVMGRIPGKIDVPLIKLGKSDLIRLIASNIRFEFKFAWIKKQIPGFISKTRAWCAEAGEKLEKVGSAGELRDFWLHEIGPYALKAFWMLRCGMKLFTDSAAKLGSELEKLVGAEDANMLSSNLRGGEEGLESLGVLEGLSRVAKGLMDRDDYVKRYGHRGPSEIELSAPRPFEDPHWLEVQIEQSGKSPVDAMDLLEKQNEKYNEAVARLKATYPARAEYIMGKIEKTAKEARDREAIRSETMRVIWIVRRFCLKAGRLSGLDEDIFFVTIDEMLEALAGNSRFKAYIPVRRKKYEAFRKLSAYPTFIKGSFDPSKWAADPNRRSDVFDAGGSFEPPADSNTITGFPGSAGIVEGTVRKLNGPEEEASLKAGEILLASTTNIGWTPLFPRVSAIITDIGAPLSHAAIVARELGVPAVVGCGNATMRLKTGDRVVVDGARGTVKIIK